MWFYLSFADECFLGAEIVPGKDFLDAVRVTHESSINPGGEVLGCPLGNDLLPPIAFRNRLLSYGEVHDAFSTLSGCVRLGEIGTLEFEGFGEGSEGQTTDASTGFERLT